jgi:hypothetical protein
VKGYDVVSSEGQKIGKVTDVLDGFVIVEVGRVMRTRRPLPKEFAHAQDSDRTVVATVPKRVLDDAPRVNRSGTFDVDQATRHYGLTPSQNDPDSVFAEETPEHELAKQRERESRETGPEEDGAAPLTMQPDDVIERRPERVYMPGGK